MINGRALKLGASLRDDRRTPIEQLKTQYFKQLSHQKIDGPNEYELRRTFEAKKQHRLLSILDDGLDAKELSASQDDLQLRDNDENGLDQRLERQLKIKPDKKQKQGSSIFHRPYPQPDE